VTATAEPLSEPLTSHVENGGPLLPERPLPVAPPAGRIWSRALVLAGVLLALYLADRLAGLLMQYWLLESLGYEAVFWTNFDVQIVQFLGAMLLFGGAVAGPAFASGLSRTAKRRAVGLGLIVGVLMGLEFTTHYRDFLLLFNGHDFGREDPVFHHDIGFYVFDLPAILSVLHRLEEAAVVLAVSAVTCSLIRTKAALRPPGFGRVRAVVGRAASPLAVGAIAAFLLLEAVHFWLRRYDILIADNYDSSIPSGAQVLDATGLFSTKNAYLVEALALVGLAVGLSAALLSLRAGATRPGASDWRRRTTLRGLGLALLPGLVATVAFQVAIALRDNVEVTPNEPVVQLPYIQRHIQATNAAYSMDKVETKQFVPNGPGAPLPKFRDVLNDPAIRNAPLWPGYNSLLERQVDPEYLDRVLQTEGDNTIYGPTMNVYNQQQKLRPYYEFMDVDTVRYRVGGRPQLFASAVRELPLIEPQPWLAWWGQEFVLFTHGSGLVMNPMNRVDPHRSPVYASKNIPSEVQSGALAVDNPAIYYGEGAGSMAYSDVSDIAEHDFPTDEGRAQVKYPKDVEAGVELDSLLKRAVFGYKSRQFMEIFFSDLIKGDSRVHYFRTPLERIDRVAPFLFPDSDPYAVTGGDRVDWMINGMTTANRYPYSAFGELGDKSDRRTPTPRPTRWVNYAQDSVKATVDAFSGQINLYKWKDEPVIDTWADVYPDLFKDKSEMPPRLRDQVQYPVQLFHLQYDDLYIYTHMKDPLTFFSSEDLFDDGDEVVGPVLDDGRAITFSIEPYYWMPKAGGVMPPSSSQEQFAMSMIFTPESALNLRSIMTTYMDGEDYGKTSMLEIPKGKYFPGPEQADSAIDQEPFISQQIGLWSRQGLELIRGHTTPVVVGNELIYIEPFFVRSKQNPVPQMERVVVVFRGRAYMGRTLRDALREAIVGRRLYPLRPGPELGGEPSFAVKENLIRRAATPGRGK
jgi:uncharacterized protein